MKFAIFELNASVDIRALPGAWVGELLGVVLGVQDHNIIKIKFPMVSILANDKGYREFFHIFLFKKKTAEIRNKYFLSDDIDNPIF